MPLPLKPPIKPQLARPAKDLPDGDGWRFEPKWDGFRTIVFRDGDDVHLQSRNGRPMNRYFPEVLPAVRSLSADRLVLDGELIVVVDGIQEFDLLGQRIHPAESRVTMLAEKWPAAYVAFDLLAEGDEKLLDLSYEERHRRLEAVIEELERQGLLLRVEDHVHSVGHCSRCDSAAQRLLTDLYFSANPVEPDARTVRPPAGEESAGVGRLPQADSA